MVSYDNRKKQNQTSQNYLTFDIKGDIQYVVEGDIISIEGVKSKVKVPITEKNVPRLTEILNKTFNRRKNITMAEGDIETLTQISVEYPFHGGEKLSLEFMHIGSYTVTEGRETGNSYPVTIQIASTPEAIARAARIIEKYYLREEGLGRFFLAHLTGINLIPTDVINR
ncbi:hypothetical protein ACFL5B_01175 [Candidatus Latescibacterota bacterium]